MQITRFNFKIIFGKVFFKRFQKKTYYGHILEKGTKNGQEKSAPAAGFFGALILVV